MQTGKLLIAARHLVGERRQRRRAVGARMFQCGHLGAGVGLEGLQLLALLLDLRDQLLQAQNFTLDGVDFAAAFPGEVAIVGERAAEAGGVALIQQ